MRRADEYRGYGIACNLLGIMQSFVMLALPTILPNRGLEIRGPRNADRVQRHVLSTGTTQAVCHAASSTSAITFINTHYFTK